MIKLPISDYYFEFDKQKSIFQNKNIIRIYSQENILLYELMFNDDEYEMFGNILLLIYYELDKVDDDEFIEESTVFTDTLDQLAVSVTKTSFDRDIQNVLQSLEDTIYGWYRYRFTILGSSNLDHYGILLEFHTEPLTLTITHYDKFNNILCETAFMINNSEIFILADIILGLTN